MTSTFLRLSNLRQARIVEIFSSLQGEGLRLGERQIFVRFGGCNLHCDYCDEPETIPIPSGVVWSRERITEKIFSLNRKIAHRSISWTGGEPLLHVAMLEELMPWARGHGLEKYLETNGVLPEALRRVVKYCDTIAMDLKLSSATGRELWSAHREFLRIAPEKTFAKVVLTATSTDAEWRGVIRLMREADLRIPLILQPATPVADSRGAGRPVKPIEPKRALRFLRQARACLKDARLIPQRHPIWKLP
jgi:organic radical activating enzyme